MTKNLRQDFSAILDDLGRDTEDRYLEYLKQKPRVFMRENLIFDGGSLDSYYNCGACRRRDPKAFCCSGYDLELTSRDVAAVSKVLPALLRAYPALKRTLDGGDFWWWSDEFEKVMRRKKNDDCLFLMPGGRGCMIHAWALDNGVDPLEAKPYICSLYPVVVVVIRGEVVISTLNRETKIILDAGDKARPCVSRRGAPESHILVRSREILTRMFGRKIYNELTRRVLGR
ncbi:MAG TPA: hypothetical protein VM658_13880 [bacterium]|nr:hypothetical protein [bacterium]